MRSTKSTWIFILVLVGISAIAYLPLVSRFGYFNDDWYLMYDVRAQGAQFFHEIFSSDRPGRAFLMIPLFSLFGSNPIYYNISAYLFRLFGGMILFWILRMIWPKKYFLPGMGSIFFTIYPGFLSQTNAIDYQSHIVALALGLLSVALTVKLFFVHDPKQRVFLILASILAGWASLSQMEYFIGIEAFRFGCIAVIVWREPHTSIWQSLKNAILKYLPLVAVPAGFLIWRVAFFQVERRATDIGFQLGTLVSSPLALLWSIVYLIQDIFNVVFVAWSLPLSTIAFQLRLRERYVGMGLSLLAVLLVLLISRWIRNRERSSESEPAYSESGLEELSIGLLSIIGGLIPVILVNRHIIFPDYSRYTLVASIGAVILLATILEKIIDHKWRVGLACVLTSLAILTHYGNSVRAAEQSDAMRNFWWQVAWRAPNIQPGTTLVANYPVGGIQEDYFVWGPANLIYYPERQPTNPVQIQLPAAVLTDDVVLNIMIGRGEETPFRRGNEFTRDFSNVLVLAQALDNSCVRVLDGKGPDLSTLDQQRIILVSPNSKLENVILKGDAPVPPSSIFGEEPEHGWCYYYQKADLARQQGDWEQVASLAKEAEKLELRPNDQIELMPFLQAYAVLGDMKQVKQLSTRINTEPFYEEQACRTLTAMAENGYPLSSEMQTQVNELFCT